MGRLPLVVRGFAQAVDLMTRAGQTRSRAPTRRPAAPAGWAPQPSGPPLEPPTVPAEIVRPEPSQLQPAQRDMADLRRELDRPLTPDTTESILDRISVLTHQLDRRRLSDRQNEALDRLEQLLQRPRRKTAAEQETEAEEIGIQLLGRGIMGYEAGSAAAALAGKTIRTPESSNVYSFVYVSAEESDLPGTMYSGAEAARKRQAEQDLASGTWRGPYRQSTLYGTLAGGVLFVTFKLWQPGQRGDRPNQPGPTYGYYDVPLQKFKSFVADIAPGGKGAGVAVWDYLRIRGTRHGHQQPYRLAQGAYVPAGGRLVQKGGIYVPRKATAAGYRSRSLPAPGVGRRGMVTSQLATRTAAQQRHYLRG